MTENCKKSVLSRASPREKISMQEGQNQKFELDEQRRVAEALMHATQIKEHDASRTTFTRVYRWRAANMCQIDTGQVTLCHLSYK